VLRKVLDTAAIKLLVDLDSPDLASFLASPIPILADDDDIVQYLTENNRLNGLAMWYRVHGDDVKENIYKFLFLFAINTFIYIIGS
jgi:hypothetical protein